MMNAGVNAQILHSDSTLDLAELAARTLIEEEDETRLPISPR